MTIKVGDRVRSKYYRGRENNYGTVIEIGNHSCSILVEHDFPNPDLHDAEGKGRENCCWYYFENMLEVVAEKPMDTFTDTFWEVE